MFNILKSINKKSIEKPQTSKRIPYSFEPTDIVILTDTHGMLFSDPMRIKKLEDESPHAVFCLGDIYGHELLRIKEIYDAKGVPIYGIPGNHEPQDCIDETGIINIHGTTCIINGITIAGWGGCLKYKGNPELCMMTEEEGLSFGRKLPPADILISHSPYKRDSKQNAYSGLQGITDYLEQNTVPLHFYGHLHERKEDILPNGTCSICIYRAVRVHLCEDANIKYLF